MGKTDEVFDIDEKLYEPKGRWDCIYPIERSEGGYYGTWTATPKGREDKNGGIGFGYSEDGLHWHAMESNGIFPDADESGAIVKKDGKYYGMFGLFGTGMIGYKADSVNGPYTRCAENTVMLPFESTYFPDFCKRKTSCLSIITQSRGSVRIPDSRIVTWRRSKKRKFSTKAYISNIGTATTR